MSVAPADPGPRSRAFVRWTLRWGVWIWVVTVAAAVPATWRTAQLYAHLRSEFEQLLPRSAPSVIAINELRSRIAGLQHLGVVVDTGDAASLPAGERLLDDLAAKVRAYPAGMVRAARTGDAEERHFLEDHAPLYMEVADLQTVKDRLEARRDWEASKEQGALLDENEAAPSLDFDDIQKRYDDRTASTRRFEDDRFASREQHTALLLLEIGEFDTGRARGELLLRRVKEDLAALRPESYAPGLRVGFTSDVAINTEETQALVSDLTLSSVVVIVLVIAVIALYFEWWRSVVILLPPLLLGTVLAFALASLWPFEVTELNSNTAFLGSIIVGNGINFGIVLLARFMEERRPGVTVEEALVRGVWGARTGTLSAALAAGVSYASLALTDFRGFRQFGFIGGIGMVLSWLMAFVLMPPLAAWMDRGPRPPQRRNVMAAVGTLVTRHSRVVVGVAALLAVGAAWEVRSFGADQIETDFSKLRRGDTWKTGEGYWGRKMDALLGSYVTPTVILADDVEQARIIGRALRTLEKQPPLDRMIASVRTLDDVVPAEQERKIALADDIRDDLTPKIRASLTDAQRKSVDRLLGNGPLVPITASDLPATFTTGLRERDGRMGREVLVYPRPVHLLWEGPPLAELVGGLRAAAATDVRPGERPARVAGSLALSADILESVRRDGVLASTAAFVGVVVVVVLLLRARPATGLVIASLLLGVLWLAGGMMALHVKINFANFIAYPITFGIGIDYSVNMVSRWELDGRGPLAEVVRTTGGAVTLCSLTTIIGYSSLLLAENRALYLFGLLAVLGEVACLSTAVVVLPACLEWVRRRAASS